METHNFREVKHRIILDDGSEKILQANADVVTDAEGKISRMIGIGQDITENQKGQQQLVERTRELEMSNSELKKFAYVASHDLQEPLRKIMTFTSLLEKEIPAPEEKVKLYMDKITAASGRMQKLIKDILKFSSIRAASESFEKVDLNHVVAQVISDLEVKIENSGARIHSVKLPLIQGIPGQLEQLFLNLLGNAIKFRKESTRPEINISGKLIQSAAVQKIISGPGSDLAYYKKILYWEKEVFALIEVEDNGIGFEEKYAGKIFEIFQRLHGGNYGGTGIGLAICKKIVDNHHGYISAESKPGSGTKFTIIIPVSQQMFFRNEKSI
ncbi:MAG: hypothetical protein H0U44_00095 [Flavisolibacter sp.]|nr:hypothetical protein [Flavisolibacter sp.]